jgi:hypothetical protein
VAIVEGKSILTLSVEPCTIHVCCGLLMDKHRKETTLDPGCFREMPLAWTLWVRPSLRFRSTTFASSSRPVNITDDECPQDHLAWRPYDSSVREALNTS